MISKQEEVVLTVALSNERIASEVAARIIDASADAAAATAILAVISDSAKERKEIREYLTVALANRAVADEIATQLELVVECLGYQAADDDGDNAALNAAQAKIKALSSQAKEYLTVALANRSIASSIASAIDASGQVAAGIADAVAPE